MQDGFVSDKHVDIKNILNILRQEFAQATDRISTTIANAGNFVGEEVNKLSGIRSFLDKVRRVEAFYRHCLSNARCVKGPSRDVFALPQFIAAR